jgi:hypothetical protein
LLHLITQQDKLPKPTEKLSPQEISGVLRPESPLLTCLYVFHNRKRDPEIEANLNQLKTAKQITLTVKKMTDAERNLVNQQVL